MTRKIFLTAFAFSILFLTSCTTYFISLDSFKQQFSGIDSSMLKDVVVKGPIMRYYYKATPITKIKCTNKEGKPFEITNSPSIETRITYGYKNKRAIFYFDRIYVGKNVVFGVESRFMDFFSRIIPIDSITKIEVQDGHKNFRYVEQ